MVYYAGLRRKVRLGFTILTSSCSHILILEGDPTVKQYTSTTVTYVKIGKPNRVSIYCTVCSMYLVEVFSKLRAHTAYDKHTRYSMNQSWQVVVFDQSGFWV